MTDRRMTPYSQPGDVEEDGLDQGFTPMPTHCGNFSCNFLADYLGRGATKPLDPPRLVLSPQGFMVCPKCHMSYGRASQVDDSQGSK